jgi:methyl-accepting chemotaxis protein
VRDMRRALDGIRSETAETGRTLIGAAGLLRKIAGESRVDAAAIQNGMRIKLGDASAVVSKLNALAADSRGHINRVIVAMQFHDITSQKLQKVKNPILTGIAQDLTTLFDETRTANRGFTDTMDDRSGNTGKFPAVKPADAPKKPEVELF